MGMAVKRTISLPSTLSKELDAIAREEGKTISAIIQDALRLAKHERLKKDVHAIQDYWACKAKERGVLTERDLERYLAKK
jgi:metal-responsive CopG/Arc/MetJ family transcriptional regulator